MDYLKDILEVCNIHSQNSERINRNNKVLVINDVKDNFLNYFIDNSTFDLLTIGSKIDSIWDVESLRQITNLDSTISAALRDGSLNTPIHIVYLDVTNEALYSNVFSLDQSIAKDTLIIVKYLNREQEHPKFLNDFSYSVGSFYGDWNNDEVNPELYFIALVGN